MTSATLGDSGFVVIRKNRVVLRSKVQREGVICKQLAIIPDKMREEEDSEHIENDPSEADTLSGNLQDGDIVILASDGLWDNLAPFGMFGFSFFGINCMDKGIDNLVNLVSNEDQSKPDFVETFAKKLLELACRTMRDPTGKPDDISISITLVKQLFHGDSKCSSSSSSNSEVRQQQQKKRKKNKKKQKNEKKSKTENENIENETEARKKNNRNGTAGRQTRSKIQRNKQLKRWVHQTS